MAISIGSNIAALKAERSLGQATDSLSTTYERLSSGLRINHASDDAAGLAVASSLNANSRVYTQAIRNLSDGVSVLSIAEGAASQLTDITTRLNELAIQSANGTLSLKQRTSIDTEGGALVDEFNRIVSSTKFNGLSLLDGSQKNLVLQAGSGSNSTITTPIGAGLSRNVGTSIFTSASYSIAGGFPNNLQAGDLNGDGISDIVTADLGTTSISVSINNGDGTFKAPISYDAGNGAPHSVIIGDVNGDGKADIFSFYQVSGGLLLGNGDGTFQAARTVYTGGIGRNIDGVLGDFNGDGKVDLSLVDTDGSSIDVLLGNGNGTFSVGKTYAAGVGPQNIVARDFNGDGVTDFGYINTLGGASYSIMLGNRNGSFQAARSFAEPSSTVLGLDSADVNHDGIVDLVISGDTGSLTGLATYLGNGDGTFRISSSYFSLGYNPNNVHLTDFNNDGTLDEFYESQQNGAYIAIGNGDGSFKASITISSVPTLGDAITAVADFNGDGVIDYAGATGTDFHIDLQGSTTSTSLQKLSFLTKGDALSALGVIQSAQSRITKELGNIGASESRVSIASNVLTTLRDNYLGAASRIMDADVAEETSQLTQKQIVQKAAASILAQANLQPELVLRLLQN